MRAPPACGSARTLCQGAPCLWPDTLRGASGALGVPMRTVRVCANPSMRSPSLFCLPLRLPSIPSIPSSSLPLCVFPPQVCPCVSHLNSQPVPPPCLRMQIAQWAVHLPSLPPPFTPTCLYASMDVLHKPSICHLFTPQPPTHFHAPVDVRPTWAIHLPILRPRPTYLHFLADVQPRPVIARPLHDISQPGAVLLNEAQWRQGGGRLPDGRPVVPVSIDPYLARVLRPHQVGQSDCMHSPKGTCVPAGGCAMRAGHSMA